MVAALVSALHILGLVFALGALFVRARLLKVTPLDEAGLRRVFSADSWSGIGALLFIGSGLWRLLAGLEKPTMFYMHNWVFHLKLTLVVIILALEAFPMVSLIRWRLHLGKTGQMPDTSKARRLAAISHAEFGLAVITIFVAAMMARGVGLSPR